MKENDHISTARAPCKSLEFQNPCCQKPKKCCVIAVCRQPLHRPNRKCRASASKDDQSWTNAELIEVVPDVAEEQYLARIKVPKDLAKGHTRAGQYVTLLTSACEHPALFAMSSAPKLSQEEGIFEFLVKEKPSTEVAGVLKNWDKSHKLVCSDVMGNGFGMEYMDPETPIFLVTTGTGIGPVKALIEASPEDGGLNAQARENCVLFFGEKDVAHLPFKQELPNWEGIEPVLVFSKPSENACTNCGKIEKPKVEAANGDKKHDLMSIIDEARHGKHVQEIVQRYMKKKNTDAKIWGAVCCGHWPMCGEIREILTKKGMKDEFILENTRESKLAEKAKSSVES